MHLFAESNISLRCPENVSEVSAQNTPQIIYYIILKMPVLSEIRNRLFLCMSL